MALSNRSLATYALQLWKREMPEGTKASELGCISRSSKFGRALWCIASEVNSGIELFTGVGGGSTLLLAHALSQAQSGGLPRYFFTMERHLGNAYHAQNILESVGIPTQVLSLTSPDGLSASTAQVLRLGRVERVKA